MIDNTHQLKLVMIPDTEVGPKEEAAEKGKLSALKKALSPDEKQLIL